MAPQAPTWRQWPICGSNIRTRSASAWSINLTTLDLRWVIYLWCKNSNKTSETFLLYQSPSHSQEDANSPSDNKEEDEGSEDESDERMDQASYDPERLKAFNVSFATMFVEIFWRKYSFTQMFVRLFVDENLDRMIPISKQPKEKVQAIIDSCARQFPEFSERARKRLRTYLKSCRRNKKTKDGWENQPSRPTPAHLTSVQAEQILSMACENESLNAKRMRIGLEPISQSLNIPSSHSSEAQSTQSLYTTAKSSMDSLTTPLSISTSTANCKTSPIISTTTDSNANSIKWVRRGRFWLHSVCVWDWMKISLRMNWGLWNSLETKFVYICNISSSILGATRTNTLPTTSPYDFSSAFMQKGSNMSSLGYYNSSVLGSTSAQGEHTKFYFDQLNWV